MNRFANKVLQLRETNAELKIRSDPTTPMTPSPCDLTNDKLNNKVTGNSTSDVEKVQNRDETDGVVQSKNSTNMGRPKNRETSEMANSTENIIESSDRGVDSGVIGLKMSSSD